MMIDLPHITLSLFFRVITWCLLFQGEVRYIHALIKLIQFLVNGCAPALDSMDKEARSHSE